MTDQIVNELSVKDGNKVVLYDRLDMESIYGREQCARRCECSSNLAGL